LLEDLGKVDLEGIDWVIIGGESGPKARPMQPAWARSLRDQCLEQNVPVFFKQWGHYDQDGNAVGKKRAGRLLDGREWNDMPRAIGLCSTPKVKNYIRPGANLIEVKT
jgi:protein gp37